MASSGLNKVFRILALILNIEDDELDSTSLSCLVLSRYFTWISNQQKCCDRRGLAGDHHLKSYLIISTV